MGSTNMKLKIYQLSYILLLGIVLTITLQVFIGKPVLYNLRQGYWKDSSIKLHNGILTNQLPEGTTWESLGANTTNLRVGVVFFAELLHRVSHKSIFSIYYWIDNIALVLNFILIFIVLSFVVNVEWALIGSLFFYFCQITTYFNHYFHPWDRISLSFWILLLGLIYKSTHHNLNRIIFLVFLMGLFVKYDLIIISGVVTLFFMFTQPRTKKVFLGPVMFIVGFTSLLIFTKFRPGGDPLSLTTLSIYNPVIRLVINGNISYIKQYGFSYPPFLVFIFPLLGGLLGFKKMEVFSKACFIIGALALPCYFMTSWFHETRAEMPLLLLLLPGSLEFYQRLFSTSILKQQVINRQTKQRRETLK